MGGWGSGRRDYATTPIVRECRALNINEFTDVVDAPGTWLSVTWGDHDNPEASIGVTVLPTDGGRRLLTSSTG